MLASLGEEERGGVKEDFLKKYTLLLYVFTMKKVQSLSRDSFRHYGSWLPSVLKNEDK